MKPPDYVALICRKGHVAVGSLGSGSSHETEFCEECGETTISGCDECDWPIRGFGPQQWMAGPYDKPKFCGKCGSPYPWTRDILAETDKFTDTITSLTEEEKQDVKKTVKDLTVDDPTTPAKSDRLKKLLQKAGPAAGEILKSLISTIATAEAKKWLGIT
jgi:hypothetical protein